MSASLKGHIDVVNLLLTAGVDVNKTNQQSETALMLAKKYPDVVNALLKAGAAVEAADLAVWKFHSYHLKYVCNQVDVMLHG